MTHSEKLAAMRKHFASLGISPLAGAPRVWRVLWTLGLKLPPPIFMRFSSVAFLIGSLFAALSWLLVWFGYGWSHTGMSLWLVTGIAVLAGAVFGLIMAIRCRTVARKYNFPLWANYHGQQSP